MSRLKRGRGFAVAVRNIPPSVPLATLATLLLPGQSKRDYAVVARYSEGELRSYTVLLVLRADGASKRARAFAKRHGVSVHFGVWKALLSAARGELICLPRAALHRPAMSVPDADTTSDRTRDIKTDPSVSDVDAQRALAPEDTHSHEGDYAGRSPARLDEVRPTFGFADGTELCPKGYALLKRVMELAVSAVSGTYAWYSPLGPQRHLIDANQAAKILAWPCELILGVKSSSHLQAISDTFCESEGCDRMHAKLFISALIASEKLPTKIKDACNHVAVKSQLRRRITAVFRRIVSMMIIMPPHTLPSHHLPSLSSEVWFALLSHAICDEYIIVLTPDRLTKIFREPDDGLRRGVLWKRRCFDDGCSLTPHPSPLPDVILGESCWSSHKGLSGPRPSIELRKYTQQTNASCPCYTVRSSTSNACMYMLTL